MVLVHAVGDSWRSFERVLGHLPESIHAFAPTLRGHADASRPESGYRSCDFAGDLVRGVEEHGPELDALIARASEGWSLERIAPLERSILRVALYEVLHRPDVPDEVAIDEAVETAKRYCGTDAPGFVNGVLSAAFAGVRDNPGR